MSKIKANICFTHIILAKYYWACEQTEAVLSVLYIINENTAVTETPFIDLVCLCFIHPKQWLLFS